AAVIRAISEDVQTTEDAAHQLAFFEGIGALDALLGMPQRVRAISAADVQHVARTYLRTESSTLGWMVPGKSPAVRPGAGDPRPAADRSGTPPLAGAAGEPQLRRLSAGLPAIVQTSPLSDTVAVELLFTGPVEAGIHPAELPGLDAVVRSGAPEELASLITQSLAAVRQPRTGPEKPSQDPATRLQQLILAQTDDHANAAPRPLAVIVSGNVEPAQAFALLERELGRTVPGKHAVAAPPSPPAAPRQIRELIEKPLSQGALGYVVEGPPRGSREALAWQMLLYVLTHDYSGRLGRSAITARGLVYHIYSDDRTDGARTWVTISTGVDPDKADAMEAELRSQLAQLASDPPSPGEVAAARDHLLGRDLTAAQSNDELTRKLARQFVETGGLRSHEQLRAELMSITPADLAAAAPTFARGTIISVDVLPATK
ncbi:MAG: zinc protease, partial [Sphingomonadales bacterium]|nr:zinc protease [Sphingomonadales bacterium]